MGNPSTQLVATPSRIQFLVAVSAGLVEVRKIKGGGQYWVVVDPDTTKVIRCDSTVTRLVEHKWIDVVLGSPMLTKLGHKILAEHRNPAT